MDRQFCATVCIIEQQRVLLIFHRKLNKWLFPGGHLDPNETPVEGARREVREETGLEIEFIRQENVWVERWNATSFERPYLCLLEEIPAYKDTPAHQHIDFIYLARPTGGIEQQNPLETNGLRWFTLKEIEALKPDEEIFIETHEILYKIFKDLKDSDCSVDFRGNSEIVLECLESINQIFIAIFKAFFNFRGLNFSDLL